MGFEFFELTASAVISFNIYIYIYIYIYKIRNKKHQQLTRKDYDRPLLLKIDMKAYLVSLVTMAMVTV